MKNQDEINLLKRIKTAIYKSSAVICVVFMADSDETVCEAIDARLIELGVPSREVEEETDLLTRMPSEEECRAQEAELAPDEDRP